MNKLRRLLKISAWTVNKILHKNVHLRKVCELFVPHELTDEQKASDLEWCKRMLLKFKSEGSSQTFLVVTRDETWLYYYDVPTEFQSRVWMFEEDDYPTMLKQSRSIKKRRLVDFFGGRGINGRKMDRVVWWLVCAYEQMHSEWRKVLWKNKIFNKWTTGLTEWPTCTRIHIEEAFGWDDSEVVFDHSIMPSR